MIGRGQNTIDAPWTLFEELLCGECALYQGEKEETSAKDLMGLYNKLEYNKLEVANFVSKYLKRPFPQDQQRIKFDGNSTSQVRVVCTA